MVEQSDLFFSYFKRMVACELGVLVHLCARDAQSFVLGIVHNHTPFNEVGSLTELGVQPFD